MLWICTVAAAEGATGPNVVFILADDLGINDLGCYGRKDHHTPNLDRLASEGTRFTAAYAACPVCSPTRAALMTGLAPARLHLTTFLPGRTDCPSQKLLHPKINLFLPPETKTIADHLKAHGYATGCFGKWHLGGKGHLPTDQGFDIFYPGRASTVPSDTEGGKGEYDLTRQALRFVEANRDRLFFLYLAHNSPHIPYTAEAKLVAKNAGAFEPTYAAVIESLDDTVGMMLKKLDEWKLRNNTLVVFTSDNGGLHVPELKHRKITHNTPFRAGKGFLYEGGIRVPLIVRWPGKFAAGRVDPTPTITTDWLPTLLDLTGAKVPAGPDGQNMAGVMIEREKARDRVLYWHVPHYTNQGSRPGGAVRDGDWKLIEHYEDGSVELFNLADDPGERTNLADRERDRAGRLRGDLARWRKLVGAQENSPNPKFDPALHRSLYVDVDPSRYDPLKATPAEFARMQEWRKSMDAVVPK
jgi:arylsulfatase A-like enzyme